MRCFLLAGNHRDVSDRKPILIEELVQFQLAETQPEIGVEFTRLLEAEYAIHNRPQSVRDDRPVHGFEHFARADENSLHPDGFHE